MNILLSCIGRRGYIADYFRSVLNQGDRIIGTSNSAWTVGFSACDDWVILPPIEAHDYVDAVFRTCSQHQVGGLLSLYDKDVAALSPYREAFLEKGIIPLIAGERTARLALDKWEMFLGLTAAGFQVPRTFVGLPEAMDEIQRGRLSFPMIVKPRFGFGSANTWAVHSSKQLEVLFNYAPDMVAQEFVAGDELNLSILAGLDGQVLSIVPCLKVLMACGETQQAVTVDAPQLLELGRRLAITTGLMGPMDVDLIRARDGTAYVIDVNPRFGGTYPLSHMAGADFPRLIVQIMEGARPSPRIGVYDRGICMLKSVGVVGGTLENGLPALSMGARL